MPTKAVAVAAKINVAAAGHHMEGHRSFSGPKADVRSGSHLGFRV